MSIFATANGGITPASFFLLMGMPLIISGSYIWGSLAIILALFSAIKAAIEDMGEDEKFMIRANTMEADDLIAELESLEEPKEQEDKEKSRGICLGVLGAMVKKYCKKDPPKGLALLCQQAAYLSLRLHPEDDMIVSEAIALLALVAKDSQVRQRHTFQADVYGLDRPIGALQNMLDRAKKVEDEKKEEQFAEVLRKGCLFLGALSDGDEEFELSHKIVEEDGLQLVLDAANWFRHHSDLANWALWAIFILCYDHPRNKIQLVRLVGITTVCQLMKNNPTSLEVNRHGTAILFDLLREGQQEDGIKFDPWEVRRLALSAGLHNVMLNAMNEFSDSVDIMMMGQELLLGTGYRGDLPQYQQL